MHHFDFGTLIGGVIVLVIVGAALELLFTRVPINGTIKVCIEVLVLLFVVVWLLSLIGIAPRFV